MKKIFSKNKNIKLKGSALIIAVVILSLIVTIALSLSIVMTQSQSATEGEYKSNQSFQSSDAGVENILYELIKSGKAEVRNISGCQSDGTILTSDGTVELIDENGNNINCSSSIPTASVSSLKVISKINNQSRAIEAEVICGSPYKADSDTAALYHFQETGNAVVDSSGRNDDGTTNWHVSSYTGICMARKFDGNTLGYIRVGDNEEDSAIQLKENMTVSAWVKTDRTLAQMGGRERVVGKGIDGKRNYDLGIDSTQGWKFQIDNGAGVSCYAASTSNINSKWHYLVGTYDGSRVRLYVDGSQVSVSSCSSGFTPFVNTDALLIGKSVIAGEESFKGLIDEVRILSTAKSSSEISGEYAAGKIFNLP